MALESFMANIQQEGAIGEDAFADLNLQPESDGKGTETPSEPPTGDKPKEEQPASQGAGADNANTPDVNQIPFHKRPEYLEQTRQEDERFAKFLKDRKEKSDNELAALEKPQENPPAEWFVELFGDNPDAWSKFNKFDQERQKVIVAEAVRLAKEEWERPAKEAKMMEDWVNGKVKSLEDHVQEKKLQPFDRNELMAIMNRVRPMSKDGTELDFHVGYELLMESKAREIADKSDKSNARKEIASNTVSNNRGEPSKKDYKTADDLRGKSFQELANL